MTAVAATHIDPARLLTVVVGDRDKLLPSLQGARAGRRVPIVSRDVKAVRFHQHGGPEVLRYEDAPDPAARGRTRGCPRPRLRAESSRSVGAARARSRDAAAAAHLGQRHRRRGCRRRRRTAARRARASCCSPASDAAVRAPARTGATTSASTTTCSACDPTAATPSSSSVPLGKPDRAPGPRRCSSRAAAFPLTFLTAWHMLITRAALRDGDVVLVLAGGSGVGQAAIQLARHFGARVFATSAPAKAERTRALGAEQVFDHYSGDFAREVKRANRRPRRRHRRRTRRRSDVGAQRARARDRRHGSSRAAPRPVMRPAVDLRHLFARQLSLLGSYMGRFAELLAAAPLLFAGHVPARHRRGLSRSRGPPTHSGGSKTRNSSARSSWRPIVTPEHVRQALPSKWQMKRTRLYTGPRSHL